MSDATLVQAETEVLGTRIFHEAAGPEGECSERPLLLLHGLNDSHRSWRRVLPELARTRRVLVPDLPGCGLSDRPDACYTLDWQARVINAWLDALGVESVDIVGHSYGGGVAQYMLLFNAARVRRLALVASGGLGKQVAFELRLASIPRVVELFGQPFMGPVAARALRAVGGVVGDEEARWMTAVNRRPGTARAFARTVCDVIDWRGQTRNFLDRAREVSRLPPVALLWGTRDRVIPHDHGHQILSAMKGAQLFTFEGCGHFPHHQCPEQFVHTLLEFLDQPDASAVPCELSQPLPSVDQPMLQRARRTFQELCDALLRGGNTQAA